MANKEVVLPDYLKDMIDQTEVAKGLISQTTSVPRISLKGRKFRWMKDGEEVKKENDQTHVIIMGVSPEKGMAKTFYEGKYNPDSSDPPDCSSQHGVVPDDWVNSPQHDTCAGCPQNAWGSATSMSGKKAKACRDSKRLMVVPAGDLEGTLYVLNVTVASLSALSEYGKFLVQHNVPMSACITTLVMDDEADYPRVLFEFAGVLKEAKGKKALERAAKAEWNEFGLRSLSNDGDTEAKPKSKQIGQKKVDMEVEEPAKKGELMDAASSHVSDVDDLLGDWDE